MRWGCGTQKEDKKKAKTIVMLGIDPSPTRCSGDRPAQPRTGGSIDQGASPARGALSSFLSTVIPCDRLGRPPGCAGLDAVPARAGSEARSEARSEAGV